MKINDKVVAITDYKQIKLKVGMEGHVKQLFNNSNLIIHWNELNRDTYHYSHHKGTVFKKA